MLWAPRWEEGEWGCYESLISPTLILPFVFFPLLFKIELRIRNWRLFLFDGAPAWGWDLISGFVLWAGLEAAGVALV